MNDKEYLFAFIGLIIIFLSLLIGIDDVKCPARCENLKNYSAGTYNGGTPEYYECIVECEDYKLGSVIS